MKNWIAYRKNFKYYWDRIKYSSKKEDWKKFEQNDSTIARNVLYIEEMEICPAYISKMNSKCKKQIILLMIQNIGVTICGIEISSQKDNILKFNPCEVK